MSALWGVGQFRVGTASLPFPVSRDDLARDVAAARPALERLGLGRGSRALFVSRLSESAQVWPFVAALHGAGGTVSCAEATRFDAFRTAMFLRRLRYDAVLGIDGEGLDGLGDVGADAAELFGPVRIVAARQDALGRLRAAGLLPLPWLHVGPAIAVGCGRGEGAHLDGGEWELEARGGEIVISARCERAAGVTAQATGTRGRIVRGPCLCGSSEPRIVPDTEGA